MAIPIQIQVTADSQPGTPPIDILTGKPAAAFYNGDYDIQLGVFNSDGSPFDISGFTYLTIEFRRSPDDIYTPPLASFQGTNLTGTITQSEWLGGFSSNAQFAVRLTPKHFESCEWLCGNENIQYTQVWVTIRGFSASDSTNPILAGFWSTFFNSGLFPVELPAYPTPILVPSDCSWYLPPNGQATFAVPIEVDGVLIVDGLLIEAS